MEPFLFNEIYALPYKTSALLCATALLLWGILTSRCYPKRGWRILNGALFGIWVLVALYYTLFCRTVTAQLHYWEPFRQLKLFFREEDENALRSFWMNILFFVPCGLFFPNLLPSSDPRGVKSAVRRGGAALLCGALLTAVIEAAQFYFSLGRFETDDLIANLAGTLIGALTTFAVSVGFFLFASDENPFSSSKPLTSLLGLIRRFREAIAYIFCGGTTTFVNWTVYFLIEKVVHYLAADAVAWVLSVLFSFAANRTLVFGSEVKGFWPVVKEGTLFAAGRLLTFGTELLLHWAGVELLGVPAGVMKVFVAIAVAFLNYAFGKLVVFRRKKAR